MSLNQTVSWLRARRISAEQGNPGDPRPFNSTEERGDALVKTVQQVPGYTTALVVLGWFSFVLGALLSNPWFSIPLKAIARVLP